MPEDPMDLGESVGEVKILGKGIPVYTSNGLDVVYLTPRVVVHDTTGSWTFAHLATFDPCGDLEFAAQRIDLCVQSLRDTAVNIIFVVEKSAFRRSDAVAICIGRNDKVRVEA